MNRYHLDIAGFCRWIIDQGGDPACGSRINAAARSATLTRVAHDAREKGKTWTTWDVVPLLDHEPESPRERAARIEHEEAQCRDPMKAEWLRIYRQAEAETCQRLDGGLPRGVSVVDTTWTAKQDALRRAAAKRGETYDPPKRQKSPPIPAPFNRPRMGAQVLDTKWAAAKWDRDHAVQVLREQAHGIMSYHPTAVGKRELEDVAKDMATRVAQNTATQQKIAADEQDQLVRLIEGLDEETRQGLIAALQKQASTRE